MDPARRRMKKKRRSGRSEMRRRRWAWENIVEVDLWARWWAAQVRWEAELEQVAGKAAVAQWRAWREAALARWEEARRFREADEERKKAEEERWLKAIWREAADEVAKAKEERKKAEEERRKAEEEAEVAAWIGAEVAAWIGAMTCQ